MSNPGLLVRWWWSMVSYLLHPKPCRAVRSSMMLCYCAWRIESRLLWPCCRSREADVGLLCIQVVSQYGHSPLITQWAFGAALDTSTRANTSCGSWRDKNIPHEVVTCGVVVQQDVLVPRSPRSRHPHANDGEARAPALHLFTFSARHVVGSLSARRPRVVTQRARDPPTHLRGVDGGPPVPDIGRLAALRTLEG